MSISWTEKLTNKVMLEKVGAGRQLLNTIRRRQWKFVGHELRRRRQRLKLEGKDQEEDRD